MRRFSVLLLVLLLALSMTLPASAAVVAAAEGKGYTYVTTALNKTVKFEEFTDGSGGEPPWKVAFFLAQSTKYHVLLYPILISDEPFSFVRNTYYSSGTLLEQKQYTAALQTSGPFAGYYFWIGTENSSTNNVGLTEYDCHKLIGFSNGGASNDVLNDAAAVREMLDFMAAPAFGTGLEAVTPVLGKSLTMGVYLAVFLLACLILLTLLVRVLRRSLG